MHEDDSDPGLSGRLIKVESVVNSRAQKAAHQLQQMRSEKLPQAPRGAAAAVIPQARKQAKSPPTAREEPRYPIGYLSLSRFSGMVGKPFS